MSFPVPPPPPPPPPPSQSRSFAEHLKFESLDAGLDKNGCVNITSLQYVLFSDHSFVCANADSYVKVGLLEYASSVNRWLFRDDYWMMMMAQSILPKLISLVCPMPHMPALRFHNEHLVKLLGKEVVVKDKDLKVTGIFEGVTVLPVAGRCYYNVRLGGSVPKELDVETRRLTSATCTIRSLEDDQE